MALRAIVPTLLGRDWWNTWDYPERIMDQFFATQLNDDDLLTPVLYHGFLLHPRTQNSIANSGQSEVKNDEKQFQVSLNVKQFKPQEVEVKVVDNFIVIHGKHEENKDDGGFCSREFTRRYMLPQGCESDAVTSSLDQEGVLTITAPKKAIEEPPKQERKITVNVEQSKTDGK
ncbi:protein lethal(2)essential for life [Trichonephila inaurata madagascariensis]|uniref:Protein lethal(2)essential for life n=1 Tax=Trichonephila inaurata madagascariensis TaxID=2747483 RepID=A0A8X6Y136_9ARAC|nr:protein lethal(2)essential for life [Trichonephila inaurata madagascariensis]